ncbi:hypothetical protein AMTRI_Chr10g7410 [Amborella trichopoda]|uniref:DNA-directed RNA polymerase subunit n=1 Tax=Amborella trichopoda TaxID=13333 RepID=U5DAJ6_AMBTC|nr:DNA-directed RNA polymerase III subunit RPC10 [Amborella trichopoda]XP_011628273.1 DNA-directed RNA polymerase III subunit RPC10 [Amborella trichopoda]XP_020531172.1 DNA-directed RNA polymerase III subunit RPC10 [Amborella trichopoda]XP_020531173.1 DNA-directed RNA polymerase III subunit RPC10 [Amborella trichopoda]ERN19245.1 hypothetical protein AMTR_s00061p00206400 [Amborella trichopoda]|eukprot:XP_006857778.1 DNA-directed RNA polymerase III subunit RPC10 [Amborella trichopoda]
MGLEFCPDCGMILELDTGGKRVWLRCPTCPYVYPIQRKISKKVPLQNKEVEPIFSADEAIKSAPKTEATCPRCCFGQAYYFQMQIRSADEPMTTFYMCANSSCQKQWRED